MAKAAIWRAWGEVLAEHGTANSADVSRYLNAR